MGKYFDDIQAGLLSQLHCVYCTVPDSPDVTALRADLSTSQSYLALGEALGRQLRYREAIEVFSEAIALFPDTLRLLRGRAGRYLSTLQPEKAKLDFLRCLELGGEKLDCLYRIGLCDFFAGNYSAAASSFEALPLCDDEMGIAVIYWHTLSVYRGGSDTSLTGQYYDGMEIGHHTAYEKAVRLFAGIETADGLLNRIQTEPDDMEYVIALYGLCVYLQHVGETERADELIQALLKRDQCWFCFSYLAAWNDAHSSAATFCQQ